jgi:hypothetical protein
MDCQPSGSGQQLGRSQALFRKAVLQPVVDSSAFPAQRVIDVTMLLTFSNSLGLIARLFLFILINKIPLI